MVMNTAARMLMSLAYSSTSYQCSAMLYSGCQCVSKYSLRLYFSHLTVSEVLVLHTSSTSAYRQWIFLALPVSVLRNTVTWPCWEQPWNSANVVSVLQLQSFGTVFFWNVCTHHPRSFKGQFWHGLKAHLFQQACNLWEPGVSECIQLNYTAIRQVNLCWELHDFILLPAFPANKWWCHCILQHSWLA